MMSWVSQGSQALLCISPDNLKILSDSIYYYFLAEAMKDTSLSNNNNNIAATLTGSSSLPDDNFALDNRATRQGDGMDQQQKKKHDRVLSIGDQLNDRELTSDLTEAHKELGIDAHVTIAQRYHTNCNGQVAVQPETKEISELYDRDDGEDLKEVEYGAQK